MFKFIGALALGMALAGCATNPGGSSAVVLPENVSVKPGPMNATYLDAVRYDFPGRADDAFADKAARCATLNLNRSSFGLTSTSSWVGPATGRVYNNTVGRAAEGGDVLLHSSEEFGVVAHGREEFSGRAGLTDVTKAVDFKVEFVPSDTGYEMIFSDIKSAWSSTGYLPNTGFDQVGTWPGARPLEVIDQIDIVSNELAECIDQSQP